MPRTDDATAPTPYADHSGSHPTPGEHVSEQTPEQQPEPTPPPATHAGAPLTDADARLWAMLAHLGGMALSFVAPLIVWLVYRERSELVDDQGREALNFQLTVLIALVAAGVVAGL